MKQVFLSTYNHGDIHLALKQIGDTFMVVDGERTWDFDNIGDALDKYEVMININYMHD